MTENIFSHGQRLRTLTGEDSIKANVLPSPSEKLLILCLGGKGGVGKTTSATLIADYCAEASDVLAIDADSGNEHFYMATMRETERLSGNFIQRQAEIRGVKHRLRAEDHAGRIDPTACQDMLEVVLDAPEPIVVCDFPAGDTATTQRCAEIIIETCRDANIRLITVVVVGAMDPTAIKVLTDLFPLLVDCDRAVVAKNTAHAINFHVLEDSEIFGKIKNLSNYRNLELEKIGERIVEAHRVYNIPWRELATTSPMRIRVEARRLRRNFHAAWQEAVRP